MNIHTIYKVFQDTFRPIRMKKFADIFKITNEHKIIDLGGSDTNWFYIEQRPYVVAANTAYDRELVKRIEHVELKHMDAKNLPLPNNSMDIAFSNSVIEHVGCWEDQKAFAKEVRRIAPNYYIQTPNPGFFIEPHFLCPFIHYLPRKLYRKLIPMFSLWYWITRPNKQTVDDMFDEIRLLSKKELQQLFPDAKIMEEKFLFFFTKSFIAYRKQELS